ncbi:MAG TPA: alanine--tRNA ligase, partial [Candidatus Baltobacteraceae bacterium]
NRTPDGVLHDLPRKAIDTGAGFERVLAVANGKLSMYETDLFTDLIDAQPPVGRTSFEPAEQLVRRRIIADHARAVTFLIADGVYPSNTDRGYVLRFLIRRAIRNGRLLGYPNGFLTALVPAVTRSLASGYPELTPAAPRIAQALGQEETTFDRTLERGNEMLVTLLEQSKASGSPLGGEDVFVLHDTFGFPSELTREIAAEAGIDVRMDDFDELMRAQRERARADAKSKRAVTALAELPAIASEFTGYEGLVADGTILGMLVNGESVATIRDGTEAQLILDRTSFYAEKGGQIGDRGTISAEGALFDVRDAQLNGEAIVHFGTFHGASLSVGDRVHTAVYPWWREEIRRHHTSAHLLQRALKDVLGDDVVQAGSWVGADRMRFDYRSPSGALLPEQRREVVARVNKMIREDHHLETKVMTQAEATASGAISMAGEKYGDHVRVVQAGPSVEFCGGTHSITTGELGLFLMLSESSIGSGVRRIESVVSKAAEQYVSEQQELVSDLAERLSAKPAEISPRVERLQADVRDLQRELAELRAKLAGADAHAYIERAEVVSGKPLIAAVVGQADGEVLKTLSNAIRSRFRSGVIALAGVENGTVSLFVTASDDLVKQGVHAGNLVKGAVSYIDGRGGGQPAAAQGGGKKTDGADAAIGAIRRALAG